MPSNPPRSDPARVDDLKRIRILTNGILADTVLAGEVVTIAEAAERRGCFGEAEALRIIARSHHIRILDAQGQLAALTDCLG